LTWAIVINSLTDSLYLAVRKYRFRSIRVRWIGFYRAAWNADAV